MGCALHTLLPPGTAYTTLDISVRFVRPVTTDTGTVLAGAGTVLHQRSPDGHRRGATLRRGRWPAAGARYVVAAGALVRATPGADRRRAACRQPRGDPGDAALGAFMSSLDVFIVNVAFAGSGHDFPGTSLSALSWVLNGYAIVFAALLVPAGRMADRLGHRRVFLAGLVVFTSASAACAAATWAGSRSAAYRRSALRR